MRTERLNDRETWFQYFPLVLLLAKLTATFIELLGSLASSP